MISPDMVVVDVHADQWIRLVRGFETSRGHAGEVRRFLILVHEGGRIVHAVSGNRPCFELLGQAVPDLSQLRRKYGAKRVISLEREVLRRIFTRAESRLSFDMDFSQQVLVMVEAFRTERGKGYDVFPPTPSGPLPPFALVQFIFDQLWPDNTSVVYYLVDQRSRRLHTSLILRKRSGDVDLLTTDLHLRADGLDARNFRTDYRRVSQVIAARVARPFVAFWGTTEGWQELMNDATQRSLSRLRREHAVIIDPFPVRLMALAAIVRFIERIKGWW